MKPVAVLNSTVLAEDGIYEVKTLITIPDISGVPHYIGHPSTRRIVERLGAVKAPSPCFPGLNVGEEAVCFQLAPGLVSRARKDCTQPHQRVTLDQLRVRLLRRVG